MKTFQEWLEINELFVEFKCRQSFSGDGYLCVDDKLQPFYCKIRQYGHMDTMDIHTSALCTSLMVNGDSFDECLEDLYHKLLEVRDDDSLSLYINSEHIKLPKHFTLGINIPGSYDDRW